MSNEYDKQAEMFLTNHGLRFRAVRHADKCPPWCEDARPTSMHGDRYRITISRKGGGRVSFDFWNSLCDVQDGATTVKPYDALACISSDAFTPDTFKDFCDESGYDADSRKAEQDWKRCAALAKRLRRFFDEEELTALAEIQ